MKQECRVKKNCDVRIGGKLLSLKKDQIIMVEEDEARVLIARKVLLPSKQFGAAVRAFSDEE